MRKAGIPDVTILVNNAAVLMHQPFLEHKDEDIQKIFDVNVLSQFWVPPQRQFIFTNFIACIIDNNE